MREGASKETNVQDLKESLGKSVEEFERLKAEGM